MRRGTVSVTWLRSAPWCSMASRLLIFSILRLHKASKIPAPYSSRKSLHVCFYALCVSSSDCCRQRGLSLVCPRFCQCPKRGCLRIHLRIHHSWRTAEEYL